MGSTSKTNDVVVWEWEDRPGLWIPYGVRVVDFLERTHRLMVKPSSSSNASVNLGQCDPSLACYEVDLVSMTQTRVETGNTRGIQRTTHTANSVSGRGVRWEWLISENEWISYDITTSGELEKAYKLKASFLDLNNTALAIPNVVVFSGPQMYQINKHTNFRRPVQRITHQQYPTCSTSHGSLGATGTSKSVGKARSSSSAAHHRLPVSPAKKVPTTSPATAVSSHTTGAVSKAKKTKKRKVEKPSGDTASDPLSKFCSDLDTVPDEECAICFEKLCNISSFSDDVKPDDNHPESSGVKQLNKCKHAFHAPCLKAMYNSGTKDGSLRCPSCKAIHGIKHGSQPSSGRMDVHYDNSSLPGHPDCGMITIVYNFTAGKQEPHHPHPGKRYSARGFPRTCYLPDNNKGRKVLGLLKKAWDRRLIFTVGSSTTTGEEDTVVWNEIHHKTEAFSNGSGHGYPDANYLDNVLAELASQGVKEEDATDDETQQ